MTSHGPDSNKEGLWDHSPQAISTRVTIKYTQRDRSRDEYFRGEEG